MSYIGNTPDQQSFTPAVDYFSGNGSTTAFTLSRPVASVAQVQAVIENVPQKPGDAFTVSGNTITFTSAPPSGTSNIYVYYTSPITQVIAPGQGTVGTTQLDVTGGSGTGASQLPTGTTAQRPTGAAGLVRYNSTNGNPEWYSPNAGAWLPFSTSQSYTASYVVVAGGGGGSGGVANGNGTGGGGAGGFRAGTLSLTLNTTYTVTVGAGGSAGGNNANGGVGSNSVFGSITSAGGGFGSTYATTGGSGGSGGGGGAGQNGGSGTSGQGNNGGAGYGANYPYRGGGGGGASAAGGDGLASGNGGAGTATTISGSSVTYAGGGGGGAFTGYSGGSGGAGGGGSGGNGTGAGSAGTANTGGGGGAGGWASSSFGVGAAGGSGIVVISIPTSSYSGVFTGSPTVTTSGSNTVLTFTSSGTYTA